MFMRNQALGILQAYMTQAIRVVGWIGLSPCVILVLSIVWVQDLPRPAAQQTNLVLDAHQALRQLKTIICMCALWPRIISGAQLRASSLHACTKFSTQINRIVLGSKSDNLL